MKPAAFVKHAGFTRTWVWPITLTDGDIATLDVAAMFTNRATGQSTSDQTTIEVTPSTTDPRTGTIAVTLTVPDTQPPGTYVLRVDVDRAGGTPLDNADGIQIVITAPSAQRPTP